MTMRHDLAGLFFGTIAFALAYDMLMNPVESVAILLLLALLISMNLYGFVCMAVASITTR